MLAQRVSLRQGTIRNDEGGAMSTIRLDYKGMTEIEIRAFLVKCTEMRAKATTRNEDYIWKQRARRARSYLPVAQCACPGCTNMCRKGRLYCSMACAGRSTGGDVKSRFSDEPKPQSRPGWGLNGAERPDSIITDGIEHLFQKPEWMSANHMPCL